MGLLYKPCTCECGGLSGGGGGGGRTGEGLGGLSETQQSLYGVAPPRGGPFHIPFFTVKVPLSFYFYRQMVPLSLPFHILSV